MLFGFSEEDSEVPSEMEDTKTNTKNTVHSPKTKISKLLLDKGYVKENDPLFEDRSLINKASTQRVIRETTIKSFPTSKWINKKSVFNIYKEENYPILNFVDFMNKMGLKNPNNSSGRRKKYTRNRF